MKAQGAVVVLAAAGGLVAGAVKAEPAKAASTQEEYEEHFIGFDELAAIDPETGVLYRVTEPYEGKYKKPLAAADFYRRVGRDDLAQEYVSRAARRNTLIAAGAIVALATVTAGIVIAVENQPGPCPQSSFAAFSACASAQSDQARSALLTATLVGVSGALIGGTLVLAGALTNPHPVDPSRMRELADRYNVQLRKQLGMQVLPLVTPDRAGLALGLRF